MNSVLRRLPVASTLAVVLCANGLAAQGLIEHKVPRALPPQADLKTPAPPPEGKADVAPMPLLPGMLPGAGKRTRGAIALPPGSPTAGPLGLAENRVLHDDRATGELFVDGRTWKGSFATDGFTYVPSFGSKASRNFPVRFAVRSVQVGARTLELGENVTPRRDAERVTFERGAVQEIYDLETEAVEQTIRIATSAGEGAVHVEIAVETDLPEVASLPGIQFGNELGRVEYGTAFLVRADGAKTALKAEWQAGRIVIDVPAELREAGVPVTIDPVITTFLVGNATAGVDLRSADISFDVVTGNYLMVWERVYSATDSDVLCELRSRTGAYVPLSYGIVDNTTTESWSKPRVANLHAYSRFLVVAEVAGTPKVIKGRTRDAALPVTLGTPFLVSGPEAGDKTDPDVGGDPSPLTPTYWAVAYTRTLSATDSDIHMRLFDNSGQVHGTTILLSNSSATLDYAPSISNSNGTGPSSMQHWFIVWSRAYSQTDRDVYGATLAWDGGLVKAPFGIATTGSDDYRPAVSSPTVGVQGNPGFLVAFERYASSHALGIVLDAFGNSQTVLTDLTSLQGSGVSSSEQPTVDCDGNRFALCYYEGAPLYVTSLRIAYGALALDEGRKVVDAAADGFDARICSTHASRGGDLEYALAYQDLGTTPLTIRGATYQGYASGGYSTRSTGCLGLGLAASGLPSIGHTASFVLSGVGTDLSGMLVGLPVSALPLCGSCAIGVDLGGALVNLPNVTSLDLPIPAQGALVGQTFAVQGYSLGTPSCFSVLRVSSTIDTKIQ